MVKSPNKELRYILGIGARGGQRVHQRTPKVFLEQVVGGRAGALKRTRATVTTFLGGNRKPPALFLHSLPTKFLPKLLGVGSVVEFFDPLLVPVVVV